MNTEQNRNGESLHSEKGKKGRKMLKWYIPAAILILLILLILLAPAILSTGFSEDFILKKVNASIPGKADFSDFSVGWIKGVSLDDLEFRDESGAASVDVKRITARPRYLSLLSGKIALDDTVINQPNISIDLTKQLPVQPDKQTEKTEPGEQKKKPFFALSELDLKVNQGTLEVKGAENSIECSSVNTGLQLNMPAKTSNFAVDMDIDRQNSDISASGQIKSEDKSNWNFNNLTGWVSAEVNNLDIEKLAPLFELAKVDMESRGVISADFRGELESGKLKNLSADVGGEDVYIKPAELGGDYISSKKISFQADIVGADGYLNVNKLHFLADWAEADVTGKLPELKNLKNALNYDSEFALNADYNFDIAELSRQLSNTLNLKDSLRIETAELAGKVQTNNLDGKRQIITENRLGSISAVKEGDTFKLDEPVSLTADIESSPEGISYNNIQLNSSFAGLQCSGTNKKLDYNFSADTDTFQNKMGQFINFGEYKLTGTVEGKGAVENVNKTISCTGGIDYKNIGLTSPWRIIEPEGNIAYGMAVDIDVERSVLKVNKFDVNTSFARLGISEPVNINLLKPAEGVNALINLEALDLGKAYSKFGAAAGAPNNIELSGTAAGQIAADYNANTLRVKTTPVNIKNLKIASAGKEPFTQDNISLDSDVILGLKDKTFRINWKLASPLIKFGGSINNEQIEPETNKLQGKADYEFDWSEMSSALEQFIPAGLEINGKADDTVTFSSVYPAADPASIPASLNADARIGFDSANYMGLRFQATKVPCTFENGVMEIRKFSSKVNNGTLNFAARADFSNKPTILKIPEPMKIADNININPQTTRELLMYVNPLFADAVSAEGSADLQCDRLEIPLSSGQTELARINGNISVNARLQDSGLLAKILTATGGGSRSGDITIHPTDFVLEDGILSYKNMQVDIDSRTVYFDGKTGLDNSLDMRVTIPVNGDTVTLPIKGTLTQPELDIESLIKGELEKQIRQGLEGLFK